MKIQCNVCEVAEAKVLCCADEATLCYDCDDKVHAANKLASKHQRVSLSKSSAPMPKCDICQETVGYFFCLEDRALLCRKCDVSIHSINVHVSAHQRFLLTGVKVGLEPERNEPFSSGKSQSPEKLTETVTETESRLLSKKNNHMALDGHQKSGQIQVAEVGEFAPTNPPFGGGSDCESFQQWQLDEIFGLTDLNQDYNYIDNGSSKADSGNLGESDCSAILLAVGFELDSDECLGHVPEIAWDVPEMPSPPTASGLNWPNNYEHQMEITPAFVPDVCYSTRQDQYHNPQMGSSLKRRRQ